MLFDTDVLIWVQRGNRGAAEAVQKASSRRISIQTYMELIQCAASKSQQKIVKEFLRDFSFEVLALTPNIGHRAAVYIEEYSLANGMRAGDAIIAATATENDLPLLSANKKHFRSVRGLSLKVFRPG